MQKLIVNILFFIPYLIVFSNMGPGHTPSGLEMWMIVPIFIWGFLAFSRFLNSIASASGLILFFRLPFLLLGSGFCAALGGIIIPILILVESSKVLYRLGGQNRAIGTMAAILPWPAAAALLVFLAPSLNQRMTANRGAPVSPGSPSSPSVSANSPDHVGNLKQHPKPPRKPPEPEWRTWTDATGAHTTVAQFKGVTDGKVTLRKRDGGETVVPMEKLSTGDQAWVSKNTADEASQSTGPIAPDAESPRPEESLSGTWQASTGARFRIDDDGEALTISLLESDLLSEFAGQLRRSNEQQSSRSFTGTLQAGFRQNGFKRYSIRVTGTHDDSGQLRLRCADWPTWNNRGKNLGTRVLNETWTRQ